jgi:carboxyl-terminal processing protease
MKKEKVSVNLTENIKKNSVKAVPIWVCVLTSLLCIIVTVVAIFAVLSLGSVGKISLKLKAIDKLIEKNFLGEIDYSKLEDTALSGYIKGLDDKYSFYKNAEETEEINNSLKGNATGIGISVFYDSESSCFQVIRINNGSPAEAMGIKPGDKIVSVDGKTVKELGPEGSLKKLKKDIGETSVCKILRGSQTLEITVTHKEFVQQSVYYRLVENYGYIYFTDFNEATVKQFKNAMDYLKNNDVKGLIFDLRDNGGGTVDSVCKILDILVGKCDLITVKYADGSKKVLYKSEKGEISLPMTVLTNENTASAAELFAATIKDMNKGVLIGETTYGKGVMQRTYSLSDGSCVRFTVAEFFPAGGKSFNEVGLVPDYEVSFTEEEAKNKFVLGDKDPYILKAVEELNNAKR